MVNNVNNISFEIYNNDNKITKDKYDIIYKIIVENEKSNDDMYNKWVNMITSTPNYNILITKYDDIVVGFIAFMYLDMGLMLSEVQIKKEYQGKYNILKYSLNEVINISNKDNFKYDYIYGTINDKHTKSRDVFTHIGFVKQDGVLYRISHNKLMSWIKK